jgi:phosphotriesterase-related protein
MNRRDVLRAGAATGLVQLAPRPLMAQDQAYRVMTVRGPIAPKEMGPTLPHEHVLVDFVGAARVAPDRYDADEVVRAALPHLRRTREQGIRTLGSTTWIASSPRRGIGWVQSTCSRTAVRSVGSAAILA